MFPFLVLSESATVDQIHEQNFMENFDKIRYEFVLVELKSVIADIMY